MPVNTCRPNTKNQEETKMKNQPTPQAQGIKTETTIKNRYNTKKTTKDNRDYGFKAGSVNKPEKAKR
jgi:hypothetical protein